MVYFSFFRRQLAFLFILVISLMPFFTSAQGNLILTDYSVDYQNAIQHINKRDALNFVVEEFITIQENVSGDYSASFLFFFCLLQVYF